MATETGNLLTLLLHLVEKVPYLSEIEHDAELDLLRLVERDLGANGIVPPATGPTNTPAPAPAVEVPGPVAQPTSAVAPIATFPGVAAPEEANAFSGVTPD